MLRSHTHFRRSQLTTICLAAFDGLREGVSHPPSTAGRRIAGGSTRPQIAFSTEESGRVSPWPIALSAATSLNQAYSFAHAAERQSRLLRNRQRQNKQRLR